ANHVALYLRDHSRCQRCTMPPTASAPLSSGTSGISGLASPPAARALASPKVARVGAGPEHERDGHGLEPGLMHRIQLGGVRFTLGEEIPDGQGQDRKSVV